MCDGNVFRLKSLCDSLRLKNSSNHVQRELMNKKIQVDRHEWSALFVSFLYYFCILSSYYIMRPIRDQFAAGVGSAQLPVFFSATFIITLLLTPAFSWLVSYWPRKIVIPVVYVFFIACQLIFIPLFNNPNLLSIHTLGIIFFVWVSVFNLFVVSVFWSFMSDIWSKLQARRLFPLIALGGTTGAICGPIITKNLVDQTGLGSLLVVSIVLLRSLIICIVYLGNWAHKYALNRNKRGSENAIGGGILDGLKQIFSNVFIASMALMMVLNEGIHTIAYVLITDYSGITFLNDPIAQTHFAASLDCGSKCYSNYSSVNCGKMVVGALWC